jgi:hypothetical protein
LNRHTAKYGNHFVIAKTVAPCEIREGDLVDFEDMELLEVDTTVFLEDRMQIRFTNATPFYLNLNEIERVRIYRRSICTK